MATTDDGTTSVGPEPDAEPPQGQTRDPVPETPPSTEAQTSAAPQRAEPAPWVRTAKRYGPFVVVAAVVVAAIAVFGGGGGDDDSGSGGDQAASGIDQEALIRSGPMTPQKAELEGRTDVDFGPHCDTDTGRIMLPTTYAPPCVQPFAGDNGGETSSGVTGNEILVVRYDTDPQVDPLLSAQLALTGADVDPASARQTIQDYVDEFQQVYETYGRTVRVVPFTGSGASDDTDAARADALAIADMHPFAVIGGPSRAGPAFASTLAEEGILCVGTCPLAVPEDITRANQPYILPTASTPNQAAALAAELIGNLAGPGPAQYAGDEAMQGQDRVYGLLHYDNPDGDYTDVTQTLVDGLGDKGIDITTSLEFTLDLNRMQDNANSIIGRLKEDGVTTVIYTGDPLTPRALTEAATEQDYHPEWIMSSTVLADTALFGRTYDQDQWIHGFGISIPPARGEEATGDWYHLYDWAYGHEPPNNTYNILAPELLTLFNGIQLAGPELTPESFRDGLFRYPPSGGTATAPQTSRGDQGVWPDLDLGGVDDATIVWWDPSASGVDETGNEGQGLYRYANGGQRYTLGHFPETAEEAGLFDEARSVTIYDQPPPEAQPPDYPPPDL